MFQSTVFWCCCLSFHFASRRIFFLSSVILTSSKKFIIAEQIPIIWQLLPLSVLSEFLHFFVSMSTILPSFYLFLLSSLLSFRYPLIPIYLIPLLYSCQTRPSSDTPLSLSLCLISAFPPLRLTRVFRGGKQFTASCAHQVTAAATVFRSPAFNLCVVFSLYL